MSSDTPMPPLTQAQELFLHESAAIKLQYFWRKRLHLTTVRIVRQHMNMGVTIAYTTTVSFEQLVLFVRENNPKSLAKEASRRIYMLTTSRHGLPLTPPLENHNGAQDEPQDEPQDDHPNGPQNATPNMGKVNARIFLAAYMIAIHPNRVFETMDPLTQPVFESANQMIQSFEAICNSIMSSETGSFAEVPHDLTADFPTLFVNYFRNFQAWKTPDEVRLVARIRQALLALYQALNLLPADEPEDSPLRVEFQTQVTRLREKLRQISGDAALAALDAERINHTPPAPPAQGQNADGNNPTGAGIPGGPGDAVAPPPAVLNNSPVPPRMSNEQISYSILINGTFVIDDDDDTNGAQRGTFFGELRERYREVFWETIEYDFSQPTPVFTRALSILKEIHTGLSTIPDAPLSAQDAAVLNETINIEHIRAQAEAGLFGWSSCVRLVAAIVGVVNEVQAEARAEQTMARWTQVSAALDEATIDAQLRPRALANALKFILNRITAISADAARAHVDIIAPVIRAEGVEYLRGKFQTALDEGTLTLQRTTEWINRIVHDNPNMVEALIEDRQPEALNLHHDCILSFVTSNNLCITQHGTLLPETLIQLAHYIHDMNLEIQSLTKIATLLSMVYSVEPPAEAVIDTIIARITAQVDHVALDDNITPIIVEEITPHVNAPVLRRIQGLMPMAMDPLNGIRQLMHIRMSSTLRSIVLTGLAPDTTHPIVTRLLPRIRKIATVFVRMSTLDRRVHLPTYTRLVREAAQGMQANV